MSSRDDYAPGAARGARVEKDGDRWTLVLVRELRHPPAKVWAALTDLAQLREWAPFDADRDLGTPGPAQLCTVGMPNVQVSQTTVRRAQTPRLLEYDWGGNDMRWGLEAIAGGTRLTLRHDVDKSFVSMGAAGWHICLDVLDRFVGGDSLGRIVGAEAMKFQWQRLNAEYAAQFGMDAPVWPPKSGGG